MLRPEDPKARCPEHVVAQMEAAHPAEEQVVVDRIEEAYQAHCCIVLAMRPVPRNVDSAFVASGRNTAGET